MKKIALLFVVPLAFSLAALATDEKESKKESVTTTAEHKFFAPSDLKWGDGPPALPPGGKMVVLDGDPGKKGSFTVRLQMPAGYRIPPHTHPSPERITVMSGTLNLGMGDKFDETAGKELTAGSFAVMPAGMKHFAWSGGETVVQIQSEGPFVIKYVNPADDSRNTKK